MNGPKILVVDDDEDIVGMVQTKLAGAGLSSDTACTAKEGLALMRKNLYLVVVLDIHMPGMSGVEMISALKQISPLVQVIMLTADASIERVIDCVDRGVVDFFSKSDPLIQMVESVGTALGRGARWASWMGSRSRQKPLAVAGEMS